MVIEPTLESRVPLPSNVNDPVLQTGWFQSPPAYVPAASTGGFVSDWAVEM